MMSEAISQSQEQQALLAERGEHLRRLARFALVDDVPNPWGLGGGPRNGSGMGESETPNV